MADKSESRARHLDTGVPVASCRREDLRFDDVTRKNGTVIVFICNHCPHVKAAIDRLVADARVLLGE